MRYLIPLFLALGLTLAACDSADPIGPDPVEPLEVIRVTDLPADPVQRDQETGQPTSTPTNLYTLYSLRENRVVLAHDNPNRADSASTAWDIGFHGTTVIFNSGVSGPGNAAVQIVQNAFDQVIEAPADGYRQDAQGNLAIPTGGGNGWYTYVSQGFGGYIIPTPGRTLVIRTADGTYAKLRFISYYEGQPEEPINFRTENDRHYTFEYVHQPDGTRSFANVE